MKKKPFPLHPAQKDVFIDQLLDLDSPHYNIGGYIKLVGNLDKATFSQAVNSTPEVFDAYKIRLGTDTSNPSFFLEDDYAVLEFEELNFSKEGNPHQFALQWMEENFNAPFNIQRDELLFTHYLIKVGENEHWFYGKYHHLITDGYGFTVFVQYLASKYKSLLSGEGIQFKFPSYVDEVTKAAAFYDSPGYEAEGEYWKERIRENPQKILQKKSINDNSREKKSSTFILNASNSQSSLFTELQLQTRVSLQQLTIAALIIYFGKTTSGTDFVFGIPLHKRGSKVLRTIVGMFSGIQPFKGKYDKNYVLINFLKEISLAQRKDYRFQDYLIGDLSKHFQTTTFGEGYLTDIVVNYEPLNFQTDFGEEVASTVLRLANEYEVTPLQLVWRDYGSNRPLQLHIHYRNEYFDHSEIELLAHRLTYILEQFPERLEAAIGGINILPPLEIDLLKAFNQTAKSYPQNKTIIDLFEEQVRKTPSAIAIVFDGHQLTFFQLNRKANQFAHYLRNKGVREEILVPICIERGLEMIIGLLGIMKAGGAYVPIDPEYPLERIVYMVEDTSATLIVSSGKSRKKLPVNNRFEIIEVDVNSLEISGQSTEDLQMAINPSQLAYVIYTSGSTGNPKGVMIEHCNVYSFICWCCEEFANNRFDVVYASTSICFDLSVYEIFYPLTIGKKVRIIENGLQAAKYLSEDTKVLINSVPVVIEHLLKEGTNLSNVSLINMAGEPIPLHVKQGLDTDRIEVRNLYGPSEDTTYSTVYKLKPDEPILIGKPIANTQVFITDSEGQLVPIGVAGEICLGGSGVARGYLNRPELTSQKFVKNRFSDATGSLVYETGDLGRWLANGQLEYLGRIDDQVKVRGFRIEPGEIESVLVQSRLVEQAVVVAKVDGKGSKRLVAYVVVKGELNSEAISSYLRSKLPEYMVPALWMALGSLPLTPNGKIDRKALPNPDSVDQTSKEYVAPRNEFETTLAEVWQELLLTEKVGIYDNFFELGGDSIITIQAISRINRAGYSIKPKDFFIHQTIARLSSSITNSTDKRSAYVTEQGVLKGPANLLPIQEWYFENNSLFVSQYNQSILLDLSKEVNEKILELAIQQILQQHDSLGFQYYQKDGKWYQEYVEKNLSLAIEDLTSLSEDVLDEEIIEKTTVFQKSLNIEQGELVRVVLFKTPEVEKKNRLFITIHHLAVDGVSWRILLEDLELLINDLVYDRKANLGDKGTSYRQWYNELLRYGQGNKVLSQKNYWQQVIKNAQLLPVDLGAGHPVKAKDISKHTVRLDVDSTLRLIKEVPRVYHTEINDNLLCALSKTLFEFFDKDKVCIGLEGHGREEIDSHINISRTVGWFTNLYPVVLIANSTEGIDGWIKSVKEQLREVPDKGIGFGVLKYINREATLQGKDCWDVIFNYLGQLDNVFNEHGWLNITKGSVTLNRNEAQIVNEKLALDSYIQDQQFVLTIGYSNIHYKTETIHRFANLYIANLVSIIDHCAQLDNASNLVFTPSDFSLNPNVSFKELDKFLQEQVGEKTRGEHIDKIYRLTGLQEGLLFHGLYDGKNGGYIQQFSCEMENLDLDAFSKSWQLIIKQHSVLRTAFYHHALSVPVQCVFKEGKLPLSVLDISSHSSAEQRTAIEKYTSEDRIQGFDFKEAPLMRFCLIKLSKEKCRMVWTAHHLLFDGWSLPVLFEDFLNTYEDLVAGNKILFRKEDQFEEFVRYIERIDLDQAELYWKKYLEGISQNTLLPFIDNTVDRNKGAGFYKSISLRIDNNITAGIKGFAQKHHLTVNTLMQGVWSLLLHKYTGNDYVVYGVVVSGRPENLEGIERRVGMYVNTLPFKSSIQNHYTTTEWLQTLQNGQVENLQHQNTPLQQIQEWIGMRGDLFDSLLVFENYPISNLILNKKWSLNITNIQMSEQTNYPLTIQITQSDNFHIQFTYNAELLQDVFVTEIQEHFLHVLTQIINSSVVHLSDISVLTSRQEQQLLFEFNNTNSNYPSDKSVVDLFELQVLKSPEDVALLFEEEKVTYAELNKRANQLAHYLRSNGVKAETLVPICIERSAELIVGILGILKAGGAYVPIDPSYPDERIQYMFEDTGASLVLTSKENRNKLALKHAVRIVQIDDWPVISEEPLGNLHVTIPPDNLAYVIYTSGSTGKPKGVMVEHGNIVSLIKGMHYVSLTNEDILLSTGSPSFDATTFEYWGMLLNGGQLVLCKENKLLDNELFKKEIVDRKVTKMWFTSSWFNHIVETDISVFEKLKTILVGGEKLSEKHIQRVRETFPSMEIVNGYGPTENTTFSITHKITDNKPKNIIPIGRPLSNRTAYVVDKAGDLVPVGVNGEIWLGGSGVSRGYLNQPELTAEKFIRSPFDENEGSILYKTGDVGRWLPEGVVQYIGRLDDQVKIRGFRIELGEVESILKQHDGIANVVVIAREDNPGHKQMVAYIVSQGTFDKEDVIVYAKNKLPDYMLPSFWVELKSLPLTANGKIDKKALPEPDVSELVTSHFVAPRNEVEFTLADVWQKLLGIERVGINNNFFDLGGNSLLAMRLTSAIRRQLETELAIKEIFLYPTIAELAEQILAKERVLLLPPVVPLKQRPERIPLSFSQERLWFVDKLEGSTQYHIAAVLHLKGDLNTANLEKAIKYVINRHEVLRTIFLELEGDPFQVIKTAEEWNLNIIGDIPFTKDESELKKLIENLINQPFDLSKDDMLRGHLIRHDDHLHLLVVTIHHIAADGWSVPIILNEINAVYTAFEEGEQPELAPLVIQYTDYAIWQRKHLKGELFERKLSFWKDRLQNIAPLQLPTDYSRPSIQTGRGGVYNFNVDKEIVSALHELGRQQGATLFMTLMSAFKVLLYRHTNQIDITVGTATANRTPAEVEGLVGFFINTLAIRDEVNGDATFTDFLQQVKSTTLKAYDNQEVPFEKVVETVVKERDMNVTPIFQVMFVLQNTAQVKSPRIGNLAVTIEEYDANTAKYDISFFVSETEDGLKASVEYSSDLFKRKTIEQLSNHFQLLLKSIAKNPGLQVGVLPMLSNDEEQKLLVQFNDTKEDYPKDKTLVYLFEEQVVKTQDAIALSFRDEEITYKKLNTRANQLAHYLNVCGVTKEAFVPICIERSIEMIVAILGILKAGATFVPIDPDFPVDRIAYMLDDISATHIITSRESKSKIEPNEGVNIIVIEDELSSINNASRDNPVSTITPNNLAYTIYTSGSTGKPKGVMVENRSIINLLISIIKSVDFKQNSSFLSVTTYSFDICYLEFFVPLISGGKLIVVPREVSADGFRLKEAVADFLPSHMQATPSTWQMLLDVGWENKELVKILIGGEAVRENLKNKLTQVGEVCNLYGPTETTIWSAIARLDRSKKVLIGKPISNTLILILNVNFQLCPVGVAGEICIGGDGLARGYLNRPELTAEKFVNDPFTKEAGARLYKTGDLGRWLEDGDIEYLGRIDDQVKVRGYRVEPGEIETVLQQSGLVKQAVVLAKEDTTHNMRLIGYVVPFAGFTRQGITAYLHGKLPEYMVPTIWVELESLPLTPNGKINKKALPDGIGTELLSNGYVPARNETEAHLVNIWQDVLGLERVGINDNFFELGGHSLLAMRLISAIRNQLNTELAIKALFVNPTIAKLSAHLTLKEEGLFLPPIVRVDLRPQNIPLSFSQERLLFIDKLLGTVQYHIPAIFELKGTLNVEALRYAFKSVIARHETLRTVFSDDSAVAFQIVKKENDWDLSVIDGLDIKDEEDLQHHFKDIINQPFDLGCDYMLRAALIMKSKQHHLLIVTMHHIAADGWSLPILLKEMIECYSAFVAGRKPHLAPLNIQYTDYSIWQHEHIKGVFLDKKLAYWEEKLNNLSPLELQTDYPRISLQATKGSVVSGAINENVLAALKRLSEQEGCTLFMTLLAVFKVLLFKYTGQQDICVGTPIANRGRQEVEDLIGFFVNTLALRTEVSSGSTFIELLKQVRTTTLEGYEHQEVPFEKVVEAIVKERDLSRSPLFQVMFALVNAEKDQLISLGEAELFPVELIPDTAKFDITFSLIEITNGLNISVEYNTELYNQETIEKLVQHYCNLVTAFVKTPGEKIERIEMLSESETQKVLVEFNDTTGAYPKNKSLIQLFEKQVINTPHATAIIFDEEKLSYEELNKRANQLANHLLSLDIKTGSNIAILSLRKAEMVIAVLAILKAGCTFVPLNIGYPTERLQGIIEDASIENIVYTGDELLDSFVFTDCNTIHINDAANSSTESPEITTGILDPVYVMYTSGTTGKPKGIVVCNQNVLKLVYEPNEIAVLAEDRVLQWSNYSFDGSIYDIFSSLLKGATLYLIKDEFASDVNALSRIIEQEQISVLFITTALFNTFIDVNPTSLKSLRILLFGGEKVSFPHVQKGIDILGSGKMIHVYGPTETTVYATYYPVDYMRKDGYVPIGKPLANTQLFVLDEKMKPVPTGVAGELYIGGDGVALGYINNPELTSIKFLKNRFSSEENSRLYRTGDLVKWLHDGNIEYLGRTDNQVKVRGYRIELNEIENVLQESGLVKQAVVLVKEDANGNKRLIGYVVAEELDKQSIINFLSGKLPRYMIPDAWIKADSIPLNSNGKIDKTSLADSYTVELISNEYVAPSSETENKLAEIWQNILKVRKVGVHDEFFELGGSSLLAVRLVSAIRKEFKIDLAIRDVFEYTSVGALAKYIEIKLNNYEEVEDPTETELLII